MNGKSGLDVYRERVTREKRDALMDAAVTLFLRDGYDRTSLDAVSKEAGVSSATLYKHFPTKAELFGAIMARFWNDNDCTPLPQLATPREGLTQIGRDYVALLNDEASVPLFRVIIAENQRFPELGRELYERGKKPYLERMDTYLDQEVQQGRLAIDDIPAATRQLLGMINDVVFWPRLLLADYDMSAEAVDQVIVNAVDTFLQRYQKS